MAHKSSYDVIFSFGKHSGKSLGFVCDVDPGYITWISENNKIPGHWPEACKLTLQNKDVSHLSLPRETLKVKSNLNIQLWTMKKSMIGISFSYDRNLLERFKFEIDGRKWNDDEKHWMAPGAQVVKIINLFGGTSNVSADDGVKKLYREELARRKQLDEIRVKEDTDIVIPGLKLNLFPYQRVGVEFIERAGGRAMIADSMGLGKTVQAIAYAHLKNHKTLIVCPKSVVINWRREIEKFVGKKSTIWTSSTKDGRIDSQYHIINYEAIQKRWPELRKLECDLLVCDEATYIKNRKTIRTKSLLGDGKQKRKYPGIKTKEVLFLTGTPVLNRPVEAFSLLNFIDPQRFNNFFQFTQKYGGWQGSNPRNLDDLHDRTKDLVIRRLKKDILTELPKKQRNDLYVELSDVEKKEYNNLLKKLFRKWRVAGKPTIGEMPEIQKYLISKKMPRLHEMIDELLEQDRGVLIYCCYVDPLKELQLHYGDRAALLHGQLNPKERQKSIDRLSKGDAKVGLFSIGAGAMGIDGLQHSIDTVIFLDQYWVPSVHEQAEDRLYRIGQTNQVSAYYMICESTIDEQMRMLLSEKQRIVDEIVDGSLVTIARDKSFFKEFVKTLKSGFSEELEEISLNSVEENLETPI